MAKKAQQEFRSKKPEVVNIPAPPSLEGDAPFDDVQMGHVRSLVDEAVRCKAKGLQQKPVYDALRSRLDGFISNTTSRVMVCGLDEMPWAEKPAEPLIPPEFRSQPMTAREVCEALGEHGNSNPAKWIRDTELPHERVGRSYVIDVRRFASKPSK
ncbi:MAG: hypothetical protein IT424_03465 [Pirellulales bacterium]|nr:hypothetical protein [Pirellulales bacterium]